MKKMLFSCLFFLIATFLNAQVFLGSGTAQSGYVPVDVNYGYNYTQQIFTKNEINAAAAGNISGVKFYLPTNAVLTNSSNWVVYVGHTNKATFASNTDWIPVANLTQVFSGSVVNNAGVVTIDFTAPFAYNNTDNLVIAAFENTPDYDSSTNRFYTYTGVGNSTIYFRSDSVIPNPASPPAGSRVGNKSVMSLMGLTPASAPVCPVVSAPSAAATGVAVLPTITWAVSANSSSYKISVGTTAGGVDIMNKVDVGNVNSYTFTTPLNLNTTYYYTVYAVNSIGESAACAERSFTTILTPGCPSVSSPGASMLGVSTRPTFTWSAGNSALGYRISIGTSPGVYNVLDNFDVGNVLNYTLTAAQQLNISTQYYYVVTSYNGSIVSTGCSERNFTTVGIVPPSNDECSGAIILTVNPSLTCTSVTAGNTLGASMSLAATPCFGTPDDDVWFKFVATSSTHIISLSSIVSTGTATGTSDMYFQVLSGVCGGTLTSLLCSDPNDNTVSGLVPGETYYVRVYTYSSTANANASFNICVKSVPLAPVNDNCATPTALTVNPDMSCGVMTSGTTLGATNSNVPVGTCSGTPDDDVWYSFVATASTHTLWAKNVVTAGTSVSTSLYGQVFSGTCGTLTSIACITSNTNYSIIGGLIPGQTYLVRFYNSESNGSSLYASTFNVCVGTPPPPPANDDCAGAIALTVNPDYSCGTITSATTAWATASTETAPSCGASGVNDDVWFKFTATNAAHRVTLSNISGSTDMAMAVYSGACGSLVQVQCSDPNTLELTGLTVGEEYKVRVWTFTSTATTSASFDICVGTLPPPPANDDCATAISLTVNPDFSCGTKTAAHTYGATASIETAPTCGATGVNDDVWFKFTATNTAHRVELSNVSGSTDMAMAVYSGACGALVQVQCSDPNTMNLTGLTVGTEYKVRVWTYAATATTSASFDICVGTPPPPPANDDCGNAINATPAPGVPYTNTQDASAATNNGGFVSACTSNSGMNDGVWYMVTGDGFDHTVVVSPTGWDPEIGVYSGTCGNFTCVASVDVGGSGSSDTVTFPTTSGTVYYINVGHYNGSTDNPEGPFSISVTTSATLGTSDVTKVNKGIKVYPNPFADIVNISDVKDVKSVSVVDLSGKIVKNFTKPDSKLNLSGLSSGMYLLILDMKDGSKQTIKVIKK